MRILARSEQRGNVFVMLRQSPVGLAVEVGLHEADEPGAAHELLGAGEQTADTSHGGLRPQLGQARVLRTQRTPADVDELPRAGEVRGLRDQRTDTHDQVAVEQRVKGGMHEAVAHSRTPEASATFTPAHRRTPHEFAPRTMQRPRGPMPANRRATWHSARLASRG